MAAWQESQLPKSMRRTGLPFSLAFFSISIALGSLAQSGQQTPPAAALSAEQLVKQVVDNELYVDKNDHSHWMYLDSDKYPMKSTLKLVVETAEATVSRTIELNGHPLDARERAADQAKMEKVLNDPAVRAKQRKTAEHDDQQGRALTRMVAHAFLWKKVSESNGRVILHFEPNPGFQPPTFESRVFAAMTGEMEVDTAQKRLVSLSGKLIQPVEFGWGFLGKLQPGGTFRVVRTEVAPHEWEITETHVHINGHAFLIKSIDEQEDEITSHYKRVPAGLTLRHAIDMLNDGTIAKQLGVTLPK
ncbi:MAG TPA: hypothetical protein VFN53_03020 [Acidobacteriaceae bacterium]|nr:hypothetical protein [Acidobacteriaceae bacterium]